jgi:gas vesicle protein
MVNENQELAYRDNNILGVLAGLLIGVLAGAVTMLLLAPQSGEATRSQIQDKGIELRDQTTDMLDDVITQVRSGVNRIKSGGRDKFREVEQYGKKLAFEQLDRVSDAATAGKKAIKNS